MPPPKARYVTLVYEGGVVVGLEAHDTKKLAWEWTEFWVDKNQFPAGSRDRIEVWHTGKGMIASTEAGDFT